jgi:SOS-response transcriptional repressor LexA
MSIPGIYILGLRQGRRQDRSDITAATNITIDRQGQIEEGRAIPTHFERAAYAKHFGFPSLEDFDANWRIRIVRVTQGESTGRIPVINLAPAGAARDFEEPYPNSGVGYAYIDPPPGITGSNLFAFVIFGDSMEPDYPNGHFAICQPTAADQIPEGSPVFVRFSAIRDHTCTFKSCYQSGPLRVELRPLNPRWPTQIIPKEEIDRMAIVITTVKRHQEKWPDEQHDPHILHDEPAA